MPYHRAAEESARDHGHGAQVGHGLRHEVAAVRAEDARRSEKENLQQGRAPGRTCA